MAHTHRSRPGWPLTLLYIGFPVWWALGLAQLMFFVAAAAMAVILVRRREPLRVPHGFALWALFLVWVLLGMVVLRAHAPDTLPGFGMARVAGFVIRAGWYAAATVVMLYVVNTAREVTTQRIVRLLAYMFVVTTCFGVVASVAPQLEFSSPAELLLPHGIAKANFVSTLVHPTLASTSEFLGYEQPRPTAPFPYSNAWGNNLALFLPFFVLAWCGRDAGWRRHVAPFVLLAAVVPITFSLNRGLWIALAVAAAYAAFRLAANGRRRALQVLVAAVLVGGTAFMASPLYDTVTLRVETPHSNERRASTAETVVAVTAEGSPIVGYGSTRTMQGSFSSLAGGETDSCHQCAAPPLGTQGFMWRLVLTTGFIGTLLCLAFLGVQFVRRARGPSPLDVATCSALLVAVLCFFVYDSLGSALFTVCIAVGLMARADAEEAIR
ncbi:hypothetical protein [Nocardioides aestuarii]|uniref:hypothetical protein n=1 Tax=Nocardioides aestuarii TaxID=252231 RepID=UPI0031D16703